MKIKGVTSLKKRIEKVPVGIDEATGQTVVVTLAAPALDFYQQVLERMAPEAPEAPPLTGQNAVEQDERGNIRRDENGVPIVKRNMKDPGYLRAVAEYNQALGLMILLECLDPPDQIVLSTQRGAYKRTVDYTKAVFAEMHRDGIDMAVLARLLTAAQKLTTVSREEAKDVSASLAGRDQNGNPSEPSRIGRSDTRKRLDAILGTSLNSPAMSN